MFRTYLVVNIFFYKFINNKLQWTTKSFLIDKQQFIWYNINIKIRQRKRKMLYLATLKIIKGLKK